MKKDELLKGLSIEELQERKEFTVVTGGIEGIDDASMGGPKGCWCDPTPPCCFGGY